MFVSGIVKTLGGIPKRTHANTYLHLKADQKRKEFTRLKNKLEEKTTV
jgi:hypothetical protein